MDIFGNFKKISPTKKDRFNYREYHHQDATLEGVSDLPAVKPKNSFIGYYIISSILFIVLIGRVFTLQVVESTTSQRLAEGNRIRPRIIDAPRGLILDTTGKILARNTPSFALAISPPDLPKKIEDRDELFRKISELSGLPIEYLEAEVKKYGYNSLEPVILKQNIAREEALILEQKTAELQGVEVVKKAIRDYNGVFSAGNILGYTGQVDQNDLKNHEDLRLTDEIGKTGLEAVYDTELRGEAGIENIEVDSRGRIIQIMAEKDHLEPKAGGNLVLNLNADLQQKTVNYLVEGLKQASVQSGAVVVMNPQTGAILSMVTLPDYDNNLFAKGILATDYQKLINDPNKPLFNRAVSGTYPSGSIIKPLLALAALQEGTINENTAFDTPAAIQIGEYLFPDWKDHGNTDVKRAIAESNNIFFYALGGGYEQIKGLGPERIKKYFNQFGLGSETGIDLASESAGLVPDPAWKKKAKNESWYIGDTYHESIGQGDLLVTPLQMITAISAIANGGKLYAPQLAKELQSSSGEKIKSYAPKLVRENFISSHNLNIVQQGMRLAVTEGSARRLNTLPFAVAGKTGTAQFFNNEKTHAWFECYAPYDNPQIAIVVLLEGGGAGNEMALPVAENVLKAYFGLQ